MPAVGELTLKLMFFDPVHKFKVTLSGELDSEVKSGFWGDGLTVIVNVESSPGQLSLLAVTETVTFATIAVFPALDAIKSGILPASLAPNPIVGTQVHVKDALGEGLVKLIPLTATPLQNV